MSGQSLSMFLEASARLIEDYHSDSAYVLRALAGSINSQDESELRAVVQAWVVAKLKEK
jgi:hypothetical protein